METKSTEQQKTRDNLFSRFFGNTTQQQRHGEACQARHSENGGTPMICEPRWELQQCQQTAWQQDESGVHAIISRIPTTPMVRVDIMTHGGEPVRSFEGLPRDVYKHITRRYPTLSREHCAYLGYEIARCAMLPRGDYVQE